ncbi:MAG: DAK2 domain-containing protein [Candidatus Dormiibacterota bacterium]
MAVADAAAPDPPLAVTGPGLRKGLDRALERLSEQRDHINELNVFPVPDGDTGTNMQLTMEAAWNEFSRLPEDAPISAVTSAAAHGSLMGARGNSGVILSQVLRGWSVPTRDRDALDAAGLCEALAEGSRVAYLAVKRPVEGTILSVARESAEAAQKALARGCDLGEVLGALAAEAWAAVERSRDQMQVLRLAGVVDAGGFGLAVILSAIAEQITDRRAAPPAGVADRGGQRKELRPVATMPRGVAAVTAPEGGFGYCTEFALLGSDLEASAIRAKLGDEAADDSALVVGEPGLLHVHVHTKEPWEVLSRAAQIGRIERLKVEDMTVQHHEAQERALAQPQTAGRAPLGVVAVAHGKGFEDLLLGLGAAVVVEGGQSLNPSTEQLLEGIEQAHADGVLLLPDNPNLELGADQAAKLSERQVAVVSSHNLPQGIAAVLAFDPSAPLEVNRSRMERAMEGVHAIAVTNAVRESQIGDRRVPEGALIGVLDGQLVSTGSDVEPVVLEALERLPKDSVEVVTLYRGAGVEEATSERLERAIRERFPGLEVEQHDGGQALYQFIISAE